MAASAIWLLGDTTTITSYSNQTQSVTITVPSCADIDVHGSAYGSDTSYISGNTPIGSFYRTPSAGYLHMTGTVQAGIYTIYEDVGSSGYLCVMVMPHPPIESITLYGPSSICTGCIATYTAIVSPSGGNQLLYWFLDGVYLGQPGVTLAITLSAAGPRTITVSDKQTWGATGAKTASVTTTVIPKLMPSNGVTLGSFAVIHPPIYSAFVVVAGSDILGLTQASRDYSTICNCTCTGYILESGLRINLTQYCYDSRINNAADIAAVSNAEAQHLALYQQFAAAVTNQYNNMTRTTSTSQQCDNLATTFINYRNQEYDAMMLNQAALDNPSTGSHPQLGREIRAHGGWGP